MRQRELMDLANAFAREHHLEEIDVLRGLETAFTVVASSRYGEVSSVFALLEPKIGEIFFVRLLDDLNTAPAIEAPSESFHKKDDGVFGFEEDSENQILDGGIVWNEKKLGPIRKLLSEGIQKIPNKWEVLPQFPLQRVMAQKVLRILRQHVEQIKRQREYELYKDRIGQLVVGSVVSIDFKRNILVSLGDGQGFLPASSLISKEHVEPMKRIRCVIEQVNFLEKGHQVILSRSSPAFLAALIQRDVPEIEEGLVEIKKIVREAGSAAKVAVWSPEIHFNPIGACLGVGRSRIENISEELQGEKIEFVLWSPEKEIFAVNALGTRVDVIRVIVNPRHENMLTLVVPDDHKKRAIGSGGQNVRMASQMIGLNLNILSHTEEVNLKAKILEEHTEYFSKVLDIDAMLAHFLTSSGFESVEDMMDVSEQEWVDSFLLDTQVARELIERIKNFMISRGYENDLTEKDATQSYSLINKLDDNHDAVSNNTWDKH